MAWKKAKDNKPAVGTPKVVGTLSAGDQRWTDDDGDTVYATSPEDYPKPVVQTTFMGIPTPQPTEGSIHSLLLRISADVAAIKNRMGI